MLILIHTNCGCDFWVDFPFQSIVSEKNNAFVCCCVLLAGWRWPSNDIVGMRASTCVWNEWINEIVLYMKLLLRCFIKWISAFAFAFALCVYGFYVRVCRSQISTFLASFIYLRIHSFLLTFIALLFSMEMNLAFIVRLPFPFAICSIQQFKQYTITLHTVHCSWIFNGFHYYGLSVFRFFLLALPIPPSLLAFIAFINNLTTNKFHSLICRAFIVSK